MCYYNIFTFECGCDSQPPTFYSPCTTTQPRSWLLRSSHHSERDHHHHLQPQSSCLSFTIKHEIITSGKCASHRLQAQREKKVRQLKDDIKRLKDEIADHRCEIDQEEAARRRARSQGCSSGGVKYYRVDGEYTRRRSVRV